MGINLDGYGNLMLCLWIVVKGGENVERDGAILVADIMTREGRRDHG